MRHIGKIVFNIIPILILLSLIGCKPVNDVPKEKLNSKSTIENFETFYNKFHADSSFQISRIKFPLEGFSTDGNEEKKWTKDNWDLLKTKIYDIDTSHYKISYKKTDKSFTEKIWVEDSGFSMEYRFELINNKWFLVYAFEANL
jgi:hypothetical protein